VNGIQREISSIRHETIPQLVQALADLQAAGRPREEIFAIRSRLQSERDQIDNLQSQKDILRAMIRENRERIERLQPTRNREV